MSKPLELTAPVHFVHTLESHIFTENLIATILTTVQAIPAIAGLRMDIELTLYICRLIETLTIVSKNKIDKKKIATDILASVFAGFTEVEKDLIGKQIQYLHNNKRIKVVKRWLDTVSRSGKCIYKTLMSI